MLNNSISVSKKFNDLPDDTCRLLATWIISHLDKNGVYHGDPMIVRSTIFTRRADVTEEQVDSYLQAMEAAGLIVLFQARDETWQWWPGFADEQVGLRADRETTKYPAPPASIPQNDGEVPESIPQDDGEVPAEQKLSEYNDKSKVNTTQHKACVCALREFFPDREAEQLAEDFPDEDIMRQIAHFRWAKRKGRADGPGWLRRAIQENWKPPPEAFEDFADPDDPQRYISGEYGDMIQR